MAGAIGGAMQTPGGAPPPLPAAVSFFVALDGKQAGPYDLTTLANHARNGLLSRSTLVWKQGMATWVPAETVPELQALFGAAPPPVPPPVG
jgi:hypothetical protein